MSRQHTLIQRALAADRWKEELSRARRYKEATLKRQEEQKGNRRTEEQENRVTNERMNREWLRKKEGEAGNVE